MKLFVVCGLVAVASAAPSRLAGGPPGAPGSPVEETLTAPMDGDEMDPWGEYLGRLQRIFANPANAMRLQNIFQEPRMGAFLMETLHKAPPMAFPSHLATNWLDGRLTKDEFMAWHPTLVALFQRIGTSPAVAEEWEVADLDKSGLVTPLNLYAMLRDSTTNRFFTSFLTLLFSQATSRMPGPFWTQGKQQEFESAADGVWGQIGGMPQIPEEGIKEMSQKIAVSQGPMAAKEFMMAMGMDKGLDSEEEPTITLVTNDGKATVDMPVETEPGTLSDQPHIKGETPVPMTDGQTMTAAEAAAAQGGADSPTDPAPLPNAQLPVEMPNGQQTMMNIAPAAIETEDGNDSPPMAVFVAPGSEPMKLPVVGMETSPNGQSTTTILSPDGSTMELSAKTPEPIDELFDSPPGSDSASSATITTSDGNVIPGQASEILEDEAECPVPLEENRCPVSSDEACGDKEDCAPVKVETQQGTLIAPLQTEETPSQGDLDEPSEGIQMTLTNEQTGEKKELTNVQANLNEGNLEVSGIDAEEGSSITLSVPAEGADPDETAAEGAKIIEESADGATKTEAAVGSISTQSDPLTGEMTTIAAANLNGEPVTLEVKSQDLNPSANGISSDDGASTTASSTETTSVTVEGMSSDEEPTELTVVESTEEAVTAVMPDGTMLIMPSPEAARPSDPFAGPTDADTVKVVSPAGQSAELPIAAVEKPIVPGAQEEILTVPTPDGQQMKIDVIKKE